MFVCITGFVYTSGVGALYTVSALHLQRGLQKIYPSSYDISYCLSLNTKAEELLFNASLARNNRTLVKSMESPIPILNDQIPF